jgi:hypothetical protein
MKILSIESFLKFLKLDSVVQTSFVCVYVISLIISNCGATNWFDSRESKKSRTMDAYITNLEWYRLMEDSKNVL